MAVRGGTAAALAMLLDASVAMGMAVDQVDLETMAGEADLLARAEMAAMLREHSVRSENGLSRDARNHQIAVV